ncbi:DUF6284 family protein [Frankia sp. AgB32]|nr:DUF6284 family protein [Frankia sp. AgB32]MCK9898368.1 DUF6284 family protein [Frankia sp. AgB32]
MSGYLDGLSGPTARDLRAIEREWPLIAAGLAEVDVLIVEVLADVRPAVA